MNLPWSFAINSLEPTGWQPHLGVTIENPFGVLSFLALPVIPELRVTDQGVWNVLGQEFVRM